MKALAHLPTPIRLGTKLALAVIIAVGLTGCTKETPNAAGGGGGPDHTPPPPYTCKNRHIHIDKSYGNGVDKETVVVCIGMQVIWNGSNHWTVDFTTSPFDDGKTVHLDEKTDQSKLFIKNVVDDTAFKYSVTPDGGTMHDPQIIIMGGGN